MTISHIDNKLETLIETCISIGEMTKDQMSDIRKFREAIRELQQISSNIKTYVSELEYEYNDIELETLIEKYDLNT